MEIVNKLTDKHQQVAWYTEIDPVLNKVSNEVKKPKTI